jgi:hypothetical protein
MQVEATEMKFQDARNYRVSGDKAAKVLGFKPEHSIDEGIEELKGLLEHDRLRDLENPRYTNAVFLSKFNTHLRK